MLERNCNECLEPYLTRCITHAMLMQKMDIFNSRAVVRYVEYDQFQLMHVSTHKMAYQKETDVCFEPKLADLSSHLALAKKRNISGSRVVLVCRSFIYTIRALSRNFCLGGKLR